MRKIDHPDGPIYDQSDASRFTNHADDPNLELRHTDGGHVDFVAKRPIMQGEELAGHYDHSSAYLGHDFKYTYRGQPYDGESTSGRHGM